MNVDLLRTWLIVKFEELETRALKAIEQLHDEQLNWKPNDNSNSIANLVVHIHGNIQERVGQGIAKKEVFRDRDAEFEPIILEKQKLISLVRDTFTELSASVKTMKPEQFEETQLIRNKERTHAEVLLQVAAHISEHVGQLLYIAKLSLDNGYVSTTIPKRN